MKNLAIIMSGGIGSRIGNETPKQLLKIGNESILELSIKKFNEHPDIDSIIIVSHKDLISITEHIVKKRKFSKVQKIIPGGSTRQLSSRSGVFASENDHDNILIHDSARPFISSETISMVISGLEVEKAVIPVVDSSDTLISTNDKGFVKKYLERNVIKRVQTPQGFKRDIIVRAHKMAEEKSLVEFTDDSSMVVYFELSNVLLVNGDPLNIKITYREDLEN